MGSEALRKPLAEPEDCRRLIGRVIEDALVTAGISKQDASWRMGYSDQSALSRWIAGVETAQFPKLWTLGPEFQTAMVVALARAAEPAAAIDVQTTVTVRSGGRRTCA